MRNAFPRQQSCLFVQSTIFISQREKKESIALGVFADWQASHRICSEARILDLRIRNEAELPRQHHHFPYDCRETYRVPYGIAQRRAVL